MVGAVIVGVVEEILFRGLLFSVLRRGFGVMTGVLITSLVFAAVHFADPEPPVGVVYGRWYAGLRLLTYMFTPHDMIWYSANMFFTLFFMGLTLAFLRAHYKSIYMDIGLHAGWVWMMRTAGLVVSRQKSVYPWLFGPSTTVAKSGVALLLAVLLAVIAVSLYVRGRQNAVAME
jgi:membrane protease YdiL (CAAX protease family)